MVTRRTILFGAGAAVSALQLSASDFWNDKKPSEWTDKQIDKLLTDSPWAKQTSVQFRGGAAGRPPMGGPGMGAPGMGGPGMGGPGMGGPGMGGGMGGPGMGQGPIPGGGRDIGGGAAGEPDEGMGGSRAARVTVRWESALPVRDAEKKEAAAPAESNYILSVSGLPMMMGPRDESDGSDNLEQRRETMMDRLKSSTSLQRKGKNPILPASVDEAPGASRALLFVFPHGSDPITLADKEVSFVSNPGPMEIKVKFPLKDMKYQGKLEL